MKNKIKKICRYIVNYLLSKMKINNYKIVFDNFNGKGFGDNPRYIAEELHKQSSKSLDMVWLLDDRNYNSCLPDYIRKVKYGSLRAKYELATAHIWVDNIKNFYKGIKKQGQYYLQTWHGGISFKAVENAAADTLPDEYKKLSKHDSSQIDVMISNSKWVTNNYLENFWYSGKVVCTGFPRNDVFFKDKKKTSDKVKLYFDIDSDTEIILYAPTFRQNLSPQEQLNLYDLCEKKVTNAFSKKYKKKFVLIKRLHPNIANMSRILNTELLKDGSAYPDMQELLSSSFALITDFSSSLFDYMIVNNRIFLYAKDYEEYISNERKLNFNITEDLPFPLAQSEDSLVDNISFFDDKQMEVIVSKLKQTFGLVENGQSSKNVAELLLNQINNWVE